MALLEAVFKRATQDRATLPFSVISKEAQVPIDEVEHVIMKALACVLRNSLFCSSLTSQGIVADGVVWDSLTFAGFGAQSEPDPRDDRPAGIDREYLVGATARARPGPDRRVAGPPGRLERQGDGHGRVCQERRARVVCAVEQEGRWIALRFTPTMTMYKRSSLCARCYRLERGAICMT